MSGLAIVSSLLGFTYFIAWSVSFYPQPIDYFRRKSTRGSKIAFSFFNLAGFTAYTIYTSVFCFSPVIRREYAERHPSSPTPAVSPWDFAFAVHALVIVIITLTQFWSPSLWGFEANSTSEEQSDAADSSEGLRRVSTLKQERRVDTWMWIVLAVAGLGIAVVCLLVLLANNQEPRDPDDWAAIDIIYSFSTVKVYLTFVKYVPQAVYNYRRKSTRGWVIHMVFLDFAGGIASTLQLFIDAYRFSGHHRDTVSVIFLAAEEGSSWIDGVIGNLPKLGLSGVSLMFDVIFLVQHYILYPPDKSKDTGSKTAEEAPETVQGTERQPLLGPLEG